MYDIESYTQDFFWQVEITLPKDSSEITQQFFLESGALGFYEVLYQENVTNNLENDFTSLYFFFSHDFPVEAFVPMALETLQAGAENYQIKQIRYHDYVAQFEKGFRSFALTDKTWLVPPYDLDNTAIPRGVNRLYLKPGLAFGTGKHETSQLMVAFLEKTVRPGDSVIDMGCGSGILCMAAGLLGAGQVTGVDVETMAVDSARENNQLNQQLNKLDHDSEFLAGSFETLKNRKCDVFVANILPRVFYQNKNELVAYLGNCRHWALSGVPHQEQEKFIDFLKGDLGVQSFTIDEKEGWLLFGNHRPT